MADGGNGLIKNRTGNIKTQKYFASLTPLLDTCIEARDKTRGVAGITKAEAVANCETLGRAGECAPSIRCRPLDECRRYPRRVFPSLPFAAKLNRQNLGIVDHQRVAGAQKFG